MNRADLPEPGRQAGDPAEPQRPAAYAFGDTGEAATRLALVAEVFQPATRRLLTDARSLLAEAADRPDQPVDLAIDLGCGPGHTTQLLAEVLRPKRAVGLDSSAAFVELARQARTGLVAQTPVAPPQAASDPASPGQGPPTPAASVRPAPGLAFEVHDVTRTPFPTGPADVLFCRFLLTHLPAPGDTIAAWASQLRPGGILLIDEVEWIDPGHPLLADYLAAVDALLTRQGHRLHVGPLLHELPAVAGLDRLASRVVTLSPPVAKAVGMFAMNLRVWRDHPSARAELGDAGLDRLAAGLDDLARTPGDDQTTITWGMRQIVYRRQP